jgi:hypothetical protein
MWSVSPAERGLECLGDVLSNCGSARLRFRFVCREKQTFIIAGRLLFWRL